ncbi:MAG: YSC84-related protein [Gammaproteobacteria bacterium]|nr:YSC84-related protein [Gammaproteobacteria bacterium]
MKARRTSALIVMVRKTVCVMVAILFATTTLVSAHNPANNASAAKIDRDVNAALKQLLSTSAAARALAPRARGILVFPRIVKAGFIIGAQGGEGALRRGGKTIGYYATASLSYGLQAGVQKFGYAMFLMTNSAMRHLNKSGGWEIGTGPNIVIVDKGAAGAMTTTTARKGIYVFFFNQKGLMAGLGIQGTKISKFTPGKRK